MSGQPYKYRHMTARMIREELLVIERYEARMRTSPDANWQRRVVHRDNVKPVDSTGE
jgi:hypothetical protein